MKKAERLLDLIAFFLNNREPVSFDEIRSAFPEDYAEGNEEAIARKFERDKADILQLGLPLKLLIGDEYEKEGYVIDRKTYGLPAIDLGPEELALLFLAGSAALQLESSPFERDLVLALNKIAFASSSSQREAVRPPRALPSGQRLDGSSLRRKEHLEALHQAIADHKTVTLSYHGLWKDEVTTRKVDPYGLAWRRGTWILVGHCHLRQAIRVFHVERLRGLAVNPLKPKTPDFELPADFRMMDHVAQQPWLIRRHEPVRAVIRFEPPVAETVAVELGPLAAEVEQDGDARVMHFEATWLEGLVPTVLWYRDRARVLAPPELVEQVCGALGRLSRQVEP
jgi:proteasome accessory factor B